MKILITGGTGFIGSTFLKHAIERDFRILAQRRNIKSKPKINLDKEPEWLDKSYDEITNSDLKGIDILIHLASHSANVPYDNLENCILHNVVGPLELFKKASFAGVKKFLVAGSCFEYGKLGDNYEFIPPDAPLEPKGTYPTSKAMFFLACRQFAADTKSQINYLRFFQVYGEGESENRLYPSLKKAAFNGEDFKMTHGEQIRDFISVDDLSMQLLDQIEELWKRKDEGMLVENLGTGNPKTILEFTEYWWNKMNAKGKLLIGEIPYRQNEVMRFVPLINEVWKI